MVCHSKIPELALLELAFELFSLGVNSVPEIQKEMSLPGLCPSTSYNLNGIICLSCQQLNKSLENIKKARTRLVECLHSQGPPMDGQPLHLWLSDIKRYGGGRGVAANNTKLHPKSRIPTLSAPAVYLPRHIMYTHNHPLPNVLTLWASYHVLIMHTPLEQQHFISQTALLNNVQCLHYIASALANKMLHPFISQCAANGFFRYFYSLFNDSEINNRNRHVLLISTNASNDVLNIQPSYHHVTSCVSAVESENASKNSKAIVEILTLPITTYYGGGTNDNAANAQKEICCTFKDNMPQYSESIDHNEKWLHLTLYENGVCH